MDSASVIAILTLVAALVTAIGVFVGPYLAEHFRAARISRKDHLDKIKENCLLPLTNSIAGLLVEYFDPSESFAAGASFTDADRDKAVPEQILTIVPPPITSTYSVSAGENVPQLFDTLLFEDLVNHFPALKEDFDRVESVVLKTDGKKFAALHWTIGRYIWFGVALKVDTHVLHQQDVVRAALFLAAGTPSEVWPNLYITVSRNSVLDMIKEALKAPEVSGSVQEYVALKERVKAELSSLLKLVQVTIETEKELKGNCPYL